MTAVTRNGPRRDYRVEACTEGSWAQVKTGPVFSYVLGYAEATWRYLTGGLGHVRIVRSTPDGEHLELWWQDGVERAGLVIDEDGRQIDVPVRV